MEVHGHYPRLRSLNNAQETELEQRLRYVVAVTKVT